MIWIAQQKTGERLASFDHRTATTVTRCTRAAEQERIAEAPIVELETRTKER